jgi:kynureninase
VNDATTSLQSARELDRQDPLAGFRTQFQISDPELIYLDGNSLGRLPNATIERMQQVVGREWGQKLIRSWSESWFDAPRRVGEKIARLVGAGPDQVIVSDSTSINLFKLSMSALSLRPERTKIISDAPNFPSDLYILQSCRRLLGERHTLQLLSSRDGIHMDLAAVLPAIDEDTALVSLSHVHFKSGYLYDAQAIGARCRQVGALVLWDLSHSAGAVPVDLDCWDADFAAGCTYKYLNGGPGAPAFLYVNRRLQAETLSPIWGWFGRQAQFTFDLEYVPNAGVQRFLVGTPPILSLSAVESGVDLMLEAGIERLREKSIALTEFLIRLYDARLAPLGFSLGSPREPAMRGAHISLRHPEGYRINRALIEEMNLVPDFREPDNLRLGLAPIYTSFEDVWQAVDRIRTVVVDGLYQKYSQQRLAVT